MFKDVQSAMWALMEQVSNGQLRFDCCWRASMRVGRWAVHLSMCFGGACVPIVWRHLERNQVRSSDNKRCLVGRWESNCGIGFVVCRGG